MKRLIAGLPAMLLLLAACGSAPVAGPDVASESRTSPTATAPPPSAAGAPSPETRGPSSAVLVDLTSSPTAYTISLVDTDGGVALTMTGLKRTELVTHDGTAIRLPYVSTTKASLYYLDGDSVVHGFRINSAPPADIRLDVPSGSEAAFAVSPDDSEIAVSVLDFTVKPVRVTLYTDSLAGGHKHVIFQSTSNYVWPVAWHSGLIVLAHAYGPYEESIAAAAPARDNPYSAVSYHLVDPSNANRQVLMGACTVSGPLSPAGSGCIQGGSIDWQGNVSEAWSQTDWVRGAPRRRFRPTASGWRRHRRTTPPQWRTMRGMETSTRMSTARACTTGPAGSTTSTSSSAASWPAGIRRSPTSSTAGSSIRWPPAGSLRRCSRPTSPEPP